MDGQLTKTSQYIEINKYYSVAGILFLPENGQWRIYAAWEFEDMAKSKVFGFVKSAKTFPEITLEAITKTMDYGNEIHDLNECKKLFPSLFKHE